MRGLVPHHLKARFDALNALAPTTTAPEPWRRVAVFAVGGLTDVGFGDSSDLLLATSHAGRGVFDCCKGCLLARDDGEFAFDAGNLVAEGIGPLAGQRIRVAGIHGGGLSCVTTDGWKIERHPLSWPDEELILSPPGQSMLWSPPGQPLKVAKLANFSAEVRAFGFSPTGRSLIIATAADIYVLTR